MGKKHFKSLLFSFACGSYAFTAFAAVSLFSDYGQIQNVQNYSSNPFWSPNAPYNQRLPQPVYVNGADLTTEDCISVVQSLISAQCLARENCKNTNLSDIRPTIMVQLSNLPGHNYVSSCSGYLDGIFESYKQQNANTLPNRPTAFPNATTPNPNANNSGGGVNFKNPYKRATTKWQQEIKERSDELQRLQSENGNGNEQLIASKFPATYADLSFSERMENDRAGLEPFKNLKAYKTLNAKTAEEWCADGEHKDSSECWDWNCGENGREAKTTKCVTYRCSKSDYYAAHEEECKRNELCEKNKNSDECMRFRCYDTDDKDFDECKKWKCQNDSAFRAANPDMCLQYECDINAFDGASNACKEYLCGACSTTPTGPYSTHVNCITYFCDTCTEYHDEHLAQCSVAGTPCTPDPAIPHATETLWDGSGNCKVTECESGWKPNADGTECEPNVGADCKPIAEHATKGKIDSNGVCKVTECYMGYIPNADGTKCDSDPVYYTIKIAHHIDSAANRAANTCYTTCGAGAGNDDAVSNILKPIVGKKYCKPRGWGQKTLVNVDNTSEKIKIYGQSNIDTIDTQLRAIADKAPCDGINGIDIDVFIYKNENGVETQYSRILLDD